MLSYFRRPVARDIGHNLALEFFVCFRKEFLFVNLLKKEKHKHYNPYTLSRQR